MNDEDYNFTKKEICLLRENVKLCHDLLLLTLRTTWKPIETAPDCDETEVLLYDGRCSILVGKKLYKNEWLKSWFDEDELKLNKEKTKYVSQTFFFNPTHWMPLPNPPKQ